MDNAPSRILTADELRDLTGYRRPFEQRRELSRMGIKFLTRADGKPVVASSALEQAHSVPPGAPNFDALG